MANFGPFSAISCHFWTCTWSKMIQTVLRPFLVGINVALTISALKSISEAADAPDGQVLAISVPHVVRDDHHQNVKCSKVNFKATFIK